jgi:hypothetical protein
MLKLSRNTKMTMKNVLRDLVEKVNNVHEYIGISRGNGVCKK